MECDAGLYEAAIEHAAAAEEVCVQAGERVEAGHAAAVRALGLANGRGDNKQAMAVVEPWWLELKGHEGALDALLALSGALTTVRTRQGLDHREVLEARMALAERAEDVGELAECYNSVSTYYADLGVQGLSGVLLEASAGLARTHHHPRALARTLINLTSSAAPEDLARARAFGREAVQVSTSMGLAYLSSFARENLMGYLWLSGEWDELDELLESQELANDEIARPMTVAFGGLVAQARGATWAPPSDATRGDVVDDLMELYWYSFVAAMRASVAGDAALAVRRGLEAAEKCFEVSGLWDDLTYLWPTVARMAIAAEDDVSLDRLMRMVDDRTGARAPLGLTAHRLHVGGLLAIRDGAAPELVESSLRAAIAGFEKWGSPPARARAQADLGLALRDQGRHAEAGLLLDAARVVFVDLRADAWLAEIAEPTTAGLNLES